MGHLLSEYADAIFADVKLRYNDNKAMSIYLASEQEKPTMRAWVVDGLDVRSNVGGNDFLSDGARLVGVRAEGAAQKLVEGYTPEDVDKARKQLEKLRKVVKPEHVRSLDTLLRKL